MNASEFIFALLELMLINIVLSGDNAVVIALACRALPAHQQKKAIFWGSFGAIGLRVILTFVAVWFLKIPFIQILGGLLLIYIAINLLKKDDEDEKIKTSSRISEAIRTIIIADFVMSLDNVLAVAGAADGNLLLIMLGLAVSIPLIIWGSQLLMRLMNRFPIIVLLGAALLGYTSGEMIVGDKAAHDWIEENFSSLHLILPIGLAVIIALIGIRTMKKKPTEESVKDKDDRMRSIG